VVQLAGGTTFADKLYQKPGKPAASKRTPPISVALTDPIKGAIRAGRRSASS
jgi:hypothetical protein